MPQAAGAAGWLRVPLLSGLAGSGVILVCIMVCHSLRRSDLTWVLSPSLCLCYAAWLALSCMCELCVGCVLDLSVPTLHVSCECTALLQADFDLLRGGVWQAGD